MKNSKTGNNPNDILQQKNLAHPLQIEGNQATNLQENTPTNQQYQLFQNQVRTLANAPQQVPIIQGNLDLTTNSQGKIINTFNEALASQRLVQNNLVPNNQINPTTQPITQNSEQPNQNLQENQPNTNQVQPNYNQMQLKSNQTLPSNYQQPIYNPAQPVNDQIQPINDQIQPINDQAQPINDQIQPNNNPDQMDLSSSLPQESNTETEMTQNDQYMDNSIAPYPNSKGINVFDDDQRIYLSPKTDLAPHEKNSIQFDNKTIVQTNKGKRNLGARGLDDNSANHIVTIDATKAPNTINPIIWVLGGILSFLFLFFIFLIVKKSIFNKPQDIKKGSYYTRKSKSVKVDDVSSPLLSEDTESSLEDDKKKDIEREKLLDSNSP